MDRHAALTHEAARLRAELDHLADDSRDRVEILDALDRALEALDARESTTQDTPC